MKSGRILVVDDEPQIRRVLRATLGTEGYDILESHSGEEALSLVLAEPPDLVLLDLNMPGIDGRTTLKAIKADPQLRSLPVTVLTTSNNSHDIQECYDGGANAYVIKPLDYRDLLETVRTLTTFWLQTVLLPSTKSEVLTIYGMLMLSLPTMGIGETVPVI